MNKIKVNKKFTGYGTIDNVEKYNENKALNADRDLIEEDTYNDDEDQE